MRTIVPDETYTDTIDLLEQLRKRYGINVSYTQLWTAIVSGRVPARRINGKWQTLTSDQPVIAEHFRLNPPAKRAS
jgi:hypothetical protein